MPMGPKGQRHHARSLWELDVEDGFPPVHRRPSKTTPVSAGPAANRGFPRNPERLGMAKFWRQKTGSNRAIPLCWGGAWPLWSKKSHHNRRIRPGCEITEDPIAPAVRQSCKKQTAGSPVPATSVRRRGWGFEPHNSGIFAEYPYPYFRPDDHDQIHCPKQIASKRRDLRTPASGLEFFQWPSVRGFQAAGRTVFACFHCDLHNLSTSPKEMKELNRWRKTKGRKMLPVSLTEQYHYPQSNCGGCHPVQRTALRNIPPPWPCIATKTATKKNAAPRGVANRGNPPDREAPPFRFAWAGKGAPPQHDSLAVAHALGRRKRPITLRFFCFLTAIPLKRT